MEEDDPTPPDTITRHSIAAVIFNNRNEVLICKRSASKKIAPGKWRFPGGHIEKGETPHEALARELAEELSVTTTSCTDTPVVHTYSIGNEVCQTRFAHAVVRGNIQLNDEHDDFLFIEPDRIDDYIEQERVHLNHEAIRCCLRNETDKNTASCRMRCNYTQR